MDDLDLPPDQVDKILQFQDLTGIENLSACRDALQRHSWDLEVAVQDQLNISEGRPSVFASSHTDTTSPPPTVINDGILQHVFYSPPSNLPRWGGPFGYLVSFVFQFCYNTLTSILKFVYNIFWKETRRQVTDPVGDVLKFLDYFNETYSTSHPVFYQGSYGQAINDAKQELRFLIVYLHQDNNQDCVKFCRETLSNPSVINYINQHSLFWTCNTSSGEGERVCDVLKAVSFPFLAVIVYKESRMTLVARMEGPTSAQEMLRRLEAVIQANEGYIESARSDRIARNLTQRIRREQDVAYMESLRIDQEKEKRRTEEEERRRLAAEEEREQQLERQRNKEAIQRAKIELADRIPAEPDPSHPQTVFVVFKMPSGGRIERRFLSSHTLKDIHNFIFCHPSSPDAFEISSVFPKKVLQCEEEGDKTLMEAGISGRQVLFVHDLEA